MIAGIAIDGWKLPIFRRHLEAAGYVYAERPRLTPGTLLLVVNCEFASKLQPIVEAANEECRSVGKPSSEGDAR